MSRHIIALQIFAAFSQEFAGYYLYAEALEDVAASLDAGGSQHLTSMTDKAISQLERLISEIQF